MLTVSQLIANGELEPALQQTQQQIRQNPADAKLRVLLFQLYCISGLWDKALNQLNVLRDLDASTLLMVSTYEQVLQCEALRKEVFAGRKTPLVFGQPQEWMALMLEALKLESDGNHPQAAELRNLAMNQAPATPGSIDGTPFAWIADATFGSAPVWKPLSMAVIIGFPSCKSARFSWKSRPTCAIWSGFPLISPGLTAAKLKLYSVALSRFGTGRRCADSPVAADRLAAGGGRYRSRPWSAFIGNRCRRLCAVGCAQHRTGRRSGTAVMADLLHSERLQPSLLDRLTDDAPENQKESREQRVMSMRQLRQSVLRDLSWLLNTAALESMTDLADYPFVANSVLNFGSPVFSGVSVTGIDAKQIQRKVKQR